ncbi:MAG: hypothetical protein ACTHWM_00170 [Yaniella sp.]|uniref:hypothetical protein n=1 Tax=Yaniella sp. TaxID=2773929 RepID=UPI003F94B1B5
MTPIPAKYRRAARKADLGGIMAVHHDRPGPRTVLAFIGAWVLMSGLTLIVPGETPLLAVAPTILFFFMWLIIYTMMAGERLVVCQRGILLGSFAPFLRPYAIRYEQIIVGSVVPISGNIRRYHKQTGLPAFLSSVRIAWWSQRGVSLAGPTQAEARAHLKGGVATSHMTRGGHPWLIGTRAPAEEATAAIARAAGDAGFTELASATAMAPPRALSGIPTDNPVQLPEVMVPYGH